MSSVGNAACAHAGYSGILNMLKVKENYTPYRPTWPRGVQQVKAPRFLDTRHMKVVRPPLLPGISWYSFLEAESTPGTWTCRMLRKKIPRDTTGDRSRDLPINNATPGMYCNVISCENFEKHNKNKRIHCLYIKLQYDLKCMH